MYSYLYNSAEFLKYKDDVKFSNNKHDYSNSNIVCIMCMGQCAYGTVSSNADGPSGHSSLL